MSARPRIALRVHGGLPARECAAQARAAEEAGFSTVWFAENAFGRGAMSGLAASALATRTIRLGVGVFNPFNRHPTLIAMEIDRKSTRLNSSHGYISYAVFCLKKKKKNQQHK